VAQYEPHIASDIYIYIYDMLSSYIHYIYTYIYNYNVFSSPKEVEKSNFRQ